MPLIAVYVILSRLGRSVARAWRDPETRGLVFVTLIVIAAGTGFYRAVEGWSWLDSLYFAVITLATVGYGDFSPATDAGKLFTIFFVLVGLGIIGGFVALVTQYTREGVQERIQKNKDRKAPEQVDDGSQKD